MSEMAETRSAIVERLIRALNRGVEEGAEVEEIVGVWAEVIDPEVEYINPPEAIERGTRRGIEGMTTVVRNLHEAGIQRFELIKVVEQGEKAACVFRLHIVGPASGVETARSGSSLWTFRGDRIIRLEWWLDPEEAFSRLWTGSN